MGRQISQVRDERDKEGLACSSLAGGKTLSTKTSSVVERKKLISSVEQLFATIVHCRRTRLEYCRIYDRRSNVESNRIRNLSFESRRANENGSSSSVISHLRCLRDRREANVWIDLCNDLREWIDQESSHFHARGSRHCDGAELQPKEETSVQYEDD